MGSFFSGSFSSFTGKWTLVVADDAQRDLLADAGDAHQPAHLRRVAHRDAVDREDPVAVLQAGFVGGGVLVDLEHDGAARAGLLVDRGVLDADAEVAADEPTLFDQRGQHLLDHVHGDREREALALGIDRRVDADDLALEVQERTARVSRVDGRIGLEEVKYASPPPMALSGTSLVVRPRALKMPAVTVCERPSGLPIATTQSPTAIQSE